jgi:hypothetical protein
MIATQPQPTTRPFIPMADASRLAGFSASKLQRLVIMGRVEVRLEPGEKPLYSRNDVEALRTARD